MSVVDEVKARLDIFDVISETVSLRKSGQSYTGFCPFHTNTKTPSFVLFPHTQTWRCFGACADGGDIFSFVMKRDGTDFKETLAYLAERAGVKLETRNHSTPAQDEQRIKLLTLNSAAAVYFHHQLINSPVGATTRRYLMERSLTSETIVTFQLGYAPNQGKQLIQHFTQRGYTIEELQQVGLIGLPDDGSAPYDRFRHRLMIPIHNRKGEVIGFGARALADKQHPKYLNSPQTVFFDKSATLYGLHLARKQISQQNQAVIVEGYMDVIQAHQQGAKNVVAQMGTALTESQLKLLSAGSPKIVLALDSDAAGNAATVRGLSMARQVLPKKRRPTMTARGIDFESHLTQEIYIAALPTGQDPDDVLRQGLEAWQKLLDQAIPSLDFYEQLILKNTDFQSPQGKSSVVKSLIPIYRDVGDEIEKSARVQRLARTIGIDERLLMAELTGNSPAETQRTKPSRQPPPALKTEQGPTHTASISTVSGPMGLEEYCLSLILTYPSTLAMANDALEQQGLPPLTADDFNRGEHQEIFRSMQLWTASQIPKLEILTDMVGQPLAQQIVRLTNQWKHHVKVSVPELQQDLQVTVLKIRIENVNAQITQLKFLQQNSTPAMQRKYMVMVGEYQQLRKKLDSAKG
ncbi:DNA primase [Anaerolineales bacterium HSG6]|nr:DNA primase [Anaerolineales bacterium HSG6]MDM8532476.1 DNA primase [Anaerolineales bacterium HSG25]